MDIPIIYASADEPSLRNAEWIVKQWERARYSIAARGAIIVLDEVQKAVGWSETVKRLWDEDTYRKRNLKVIILSSAPLLIQRCLSESLAGRFEIIPMPHWSYSEMKEAFDWSLEQYVCFGGYPGIGEFDRRFQPVGSIHQGFAYRNNDLS